MTGRGRSKTTKKKHYVSSAVSKEYISRRELEERARKQADERKKQTNRKKRIMLFSILIPVCVLLLVGIGFAVANHKETESIVTAKTTVDADNTVNTENTESTVNTENTANTESTVNTENTANTENTETTASTEDTDATVDIEHSANAETAETADDTANAETVAAADDTADTETTASAEDVPGTKVTVDAAEEVPAEPSEKVVYRVSDISGAGFEEEYFFEEPVELSLSFDSAKSGTIYYTMDGTVPFEDETKLYTGPISLEASTDPKKPNIYVLRALAKDEEGNFCEESAHTFFVGEGVKERYTTVIISIIGDPAEITDEPDGILFGSNRYARGKATERRISTEFIYPEGTKLLSQFAGLRVYGGGSRELPVVSLKLFAKKKYSPETGKFAFDLFETPTEYDSTKTIKKYDKLVLRAGGDDFQRAMIRDELMMKLAAQAGFAEYEDAVAAVTYINGEYYALNWIREYYCDDYFQTKFGKSEGEYMVLEGTEEYKSVKGDDYDEDKAAMDFNSFYSKNCYKDLTIEESYKAVADFLDVENYLRYYALQLYGSNNDWPENNYRCYRYFAAEDEEYEEGTVRDGRWRFLLHDTDICLGTYEKERYATNDWDNVTNPASRHYSPLFTQLMKREDCRAYFIDFTGMLMDSVMTPENVTEQLDGLRAGRDAEMPYYIDHMRELKAQGVPDVFMNQGEIDSQIERIKTFIELRRQYAVQYLEEVFGGGN